MFLFPRWKGENVATTEVADILGLVDFVQEVNVYGVPVPGINETPDSLGNTRSIYIVNIISLHPYDL